MKNFAFKLSPDATDASGTTAILAAEPTAILAAEPNSENLTKLRAEMVTLWASMVACQPGTKEAMEANLTVFKHQKLIDAEIASIAQHERELVQIEKRNKKIRMVDELLAAHDANKAAQADKKLPEADKNAANDSFRKLYDGVTTELLVSVSPAKQAGATSTGTNAGTRGNTSNEILVILKEEMAAGKSLTDAKKVAMYKGYSRGTTGSVATANFNPDGTVK